MVEQILNVGKEEIYGEVFSVVEHDVTEKSETDKVTAKDHVIIFGVSKQAVFLPRFRHVHFLD